MLLRWSNVIRSNKRPPLAKGCIEREKEEWIASLPPTGVDDLSFALSNFFTFAMLPLRRSHINAHFFTLAILIHSTLMMMQPPTGPPMWLTTILRCWEENIAIYYITNGENEPIFYFYGTRLPRAHSFYTLQMAPSTNFLTIHSRCLWIAKREEEKKSAYFDYRPCCSKESTISEEGEIRRR